jgi:hypothetical protein
MIRQQEDIAMTMEQGDIPITKKRSIEGYEQR